MPSQPSISHAEEAALLAEVDRFARRAIDPRAARPETPMDAPALRALLGEAEALGLCGGDEAGGGAAPWEALEDAGPVASSVEILARLARSNTSVAFAVHQRALARVVLRRAGARGDGAGALAFAPDGRLGLGRVAIARLLAGASLDAADRAVLEDIYAPGARRIAPVDPGVGGAVTLAFEGGSLGWQLHARAALEWTHEPHAHGLDELETVTLRAVSAPLAHAAVSAADASLALGAHQLGLLAIALGAVERGHDSARRYAATRRQGGVTIDHHAAILGLLGKARAAIDGVRAQLSAYGRSPLGTVSFGTLAGLRAAAGPALADAAHACVQVFGGIGYMRDTGVEKVARDVNAIRALAGTPAELTLIAAESERVHG